VDTRHGSGELLPAGSATEQLPSLAIVVTPRSGRRRRSALLFRRVGAGATRICSTPRRSTVLARGPVVKVILPLIKPAILVALLFRTLDAFRIFDNIYVLTGGANDTGSVSILGYDNLFKAFNLGLGSAISVLVFLSVAVIAFIYIKVFGASAPGSDEEGR
jgi:multiple sugar transport system permease protein